MFEKSTLLDFWYGSEYLSLRDIEFLALPKETSSRAAFGCYLFKQVREKCNQLFMNVLGSCNIFHTEKVKSFKNNVIFNSTGLFLYTLKIYENFWFSDVFMGYRKRPVALMNQTK